MAKKIINKDVKHMDNDLELTAIIMYEELNEILDKITPEYIARHFDTHFNNVKIKQNHIKALTNHIRNQIVAHISIYKSVLLINDYKLDDKE